MNVERPLSLTRHAAGLMLAAATAGALVLLWTHGLPLLRGTVFQDLRYVAYGLGAIAILWAADRLASLLTGRN